MSLDGHDFFAPPLGPVASDDNDWLPEPPDPALLRRRAGGRGGRPRAPPVSGTFGCWVVGREYERAASSSASEYGATAERERRYLEGVGVMMWEYKPSAADELPAVARGPGAGQQVGRAVWGTLAYSFVTLSLFAARRALPDDLDVWSATTPLFFRGALWRRPSS